MSIFNSIVATNYNVFGRTNVTQTTEVSFNGLGTVSVGEQSFSGRKITIAIEYDNQKVVLNQLAPIKVEGNVSSLKSSNAPVNVTGDVTGNATVTNASLTIGGNVLNSATVTNGNLTARSVNKNISVVNGNVYNR